MYFKTFKVVMKRNMEVYSESGYTCAAFYFINNVNVNVFHKG